MGRRHGRTFLQRRDRTGQEAQGAPPPKPSGNANPNNEMPLPND